MVNRQTGFCENCNSNVVHVRVFQRRFWYWLDRMTFSFLGCLGMGPWQCVDCGDRNMWLLRIRKAARAISEKSDTVDTSQPVGNYLRTEQSLAHSVSDESRFSEKYRIGIVEKLLEGKSTVSRTCNELGVAELTIQRWMKEYMQQQLDKVTKAAAGSLIAANPAGSEAPEPVNWSADELAGGTVIESSAVRKPR